ncbi:CDGP domain-containing protein [Mycobacterium sp. Dal123C01]|uniref:CDGP domain-containing protein n=1 Tax=Mycobacterium sp. Dal123C01 TaxID=3457577 RepID=UPI00403EC05F
MKHRIVGGLAAVLMAGGLIVSAPAASAGCQYGGLVASKCDGPVQPDGTWQRCVVITTSHSGPSYQWTPDCKLMGPDQHPLGLAYADPPTHIDD